MLSLRALPRPTALLFRPSNRSTSILTVSSLNSNLKSHLPRHLERQQLSTTTPTMSSQTTTASSQGNKSDHPPQHKMVYFPSLTSSVRSFNQFRTVMHTGLYSQLVSMEIPVGGDIGDEVHTVDQVLIFTSGEGKAIVAGVEQVCLPLYIPSSRCEKGWKGKIDSVNEGMTDVDSDYLMYRKSAPRTSSSCPPARSISSSIHPRRNPWSW